MNLEILEEHGVKQIENYTEVIFSYKNKQHPSERTKLKTPSQAFYYVKNLFGMDIETKEMFFAVMLNSAAEVIATYQVGTGGINACYVDTRLIFKVALNVLATQILICHNHPSGNVKPSKSDRDITKKILASSKLLDLNLFDHIIISDYEYYSFVEEQDI